MENYVISEIIKSYWHRGGEAPIYFWRTKEKVEIDLLIEEEGVIYPVEIKLTMRPDKGMLKEIICLKKPGRKIGKGAVICLTENSYPLTAEINAVPASYI